jgi:hypothetical protein
VNNYQVVLHVELFHLHQHLFVVMKNLLLMLLYVLMKLMMNDVDLLLDYLFDNYLYLVVINVEINQLYVVDEMLLLQLLLLLQHLLLIVFD